MRTIIIAVVSLLLFCCTGRVANVKPNTQTKDAPSQSSSQSSDSTDTDESLVDLISDTAITTNPELVHLLDTLFQHVRKNGFPSEVRKEENWMTAYRDRLGAYYDAHYPGNDAVSIFTKADTVLNEGVRLLELGNNWSTIEMIVYNSTKISIDKCREYGLLTQVVNSCPTEETKNLVYQEWTMYEQMLKKVALIASNMVGLNYWGGSIAGPLSTANYLKIQDARMDMYKTVLHVIERQEWDNSGSPLENAERFFFDCCTTTIEPFSKQADNSSSEHDGINEAIHETQAAIQELRPIIKEWINLMDKVDSQLTSDSSRHAIERAASLMLMKWASVVTE